MQVAGSLGATHLLRVSQNDKNVARIQMSRLPAGPSFDLRLDQLSLISDMRKEVGCGGIGLSREDERYPPVAILHGFKSADSPSVSLLCEALKGLIPAIDIEKINVKTCRRVVLFSFTPETDSLSIRHYRINLTRKTLACVPDNGGFSAQTCGVVLNARSSSKIPNLGKLVSISDLIVPQQTEETLSGDITLVEIGPRIDATLARVLSGVEQGTVLQAKFAPETMGSVIVKKLPKRKPRKQHESRVNHSQNENHQDQDEEFSE